MAAGRLMRWLVLMVVASLAFCCRLGAGQTAPAQDKSELFKAYFRLLALDPHTSQRKDHGAELDRLITALPTMTAAELERTVPIIDAAIDQARVTHDGIARLAAGMLLSYLSGTKNGPALMAPEISRLSALCRDPFTLTGSFNMLLTLQGQYPELQVPAMLKAIKAPEANAPGGLGPAFATILLLYPRDGDLVKDVLIYMQRSDLTDDKLLDFLTGIQATSLMPDSVVDQLTRYLNDPQPEIKLAALRDISAADVAQRQRLRPMLQRVAGDLTQSAALRALALQALDTSHLVPLDPYQ